MKVLDSPCSSGYMMGKKKHKLRKLKEAAAHTDGSSDDISLAGSGSAGKSCSHIQKSVNLQTVRKAIRQSEATAQCQDCTSGGGGDVRPLAPSTISGPVEPGLEGGDMSDVIEPTLWLCLQCGHQGCDRNSVNKHALKHYQTPRSLSHSMVLNLTSWIVWCYECDDEILCDTNRKLQECVEFIRRHFCHPGQMETLVTGGNSFVPVNCSGEVNGGTPPPGRAVRPPSVSNTPNNSVHIPRVKGLNNLGNTCFFNAVLQNLCQTHDLCEFLCEHIKSGTGVRISPPLFHADTESDNESESESVDGDEDSESGSFSPVLEGVDMSLHEAGSLTQSLSALLKDMLNVSTKTNTISPSLLFGQICKKTPRFKGFQQQDSHELLRHLFDGMKSEEIKRYQLGILRHFNLPENINAKKVDDDMKCKIREYGRVAKSHTFIDSLFGGSVISTVVCEVCQAASQIYEPFLDLSLPLCEEKPGRPNAPGSGVKKDRDHLLTEKNPDSQSSTQAASRAVDGFSSNKKSSKHQIKKEKKLAKTKKRRHKIQSKGPDDADICPDDMTSSMNDEMTSSMNDDMTSPAADDTTKADVTCANGENSLDDGIVSMTSSCNDVINSMTSSSTDVVTSVDDGFASLDGSPHDARENGKQNNCHGADEEVRESNLRVSPNKQNGDQSSSTSDADIEDNVESDTSRQTLTSSFVRDTNTSSLMDGETDDINNVTSSVDSGSDMNEQLNPAELNQKLRSLTLDDSTQLKAPDQTTEQARSGDQSQAGCQSSDHSTPKYQPNNRRDFVIKSTCTLAPRYHPLAHECSVMSCLNHYTSAELLTGNNKFICRQCTNSKWRSNGKQGKAESVYTNASKQLLICDPPAILTLHLKRFQQVGFSLRKVNRHVDFPLILDLAPYCSSLSSRVEEGKTAIKYALYGAVEHSGRLSGGHYTSYVRVRHNPGHQRQFWLHKPFSSLVDAQQLMTSSVNDVTEEPRKPVFTPGKWYYISDSHVKESSEHEVLKCQAYILFYERIV